MSDVPSPHAWEQQQKITDDLIVLAKGESKEVKVIKETIIAQSNVDILIATHLEKVENTELGLESNINSTWEKLIAHIKNQNRCQTGIEILEIIDNEITEIKEIKFSAQFSLPSPHIFPPEIIKKKISKHQEKDKLHSPIFYTINELKDLYLMRGAVTGTNDMTIHSIITIPLTDYSNELMTAKMSYLQGNSSHRLTKIEKLGRKTVDIVLCSKNHRSLRFFSRNDLHKCQQPGQKPLFICKGRQITTSYSPKVSCQQLTNLPNTVILEVNNNEFIIDTNSKAGTATLECNQTKTSIAWKNSPVKLRIPENCILEGKQFNIGLLTVEKDQVVTSFKKIEIAKEPIEASNLGRTNSTANLDQLHSKIKSMQGHVENLKKTDKDTDEALNQLNSDITTPTIIASAGIGMCGLIIVTAAIAVIWGCKTAKKHKITLCTKRKKKHDRKNSQIDSEAGDCEGELAEK